MLSAGERGDQDPRDRGRDCKSASRAHVKLAPRGGESQAVQPRSSILSLDQVSPWKPEQRALRGS